MNVPKALVDETLLAGTMFALAKTSTISSSASLALTLEESTVFGIMTSDNLSSVAEAALVPKEDLFQKTIAHSFSLIADKRLLQEQLVSFLLPSFPSLIEHVGHHLPYTTFWKHRDKWLADPNHVFASQRLVKLLHMGLDKRENGVANKILDLFDSHEHLHPLPFIGSDGNTSLILACAHEFKSVASRLIDIFGDAVLPSQVNDHGNTALILASSFHMEYVVRKLINSFGDNCLPAHANNGGYTAYMRAMITGDYILSDYEDKTAATLLEMMEKDLNPSHKNKQGQTLLMLACQGASRNTDKLIDKFGKELLPSAVNTFGETALMLCKDDHTALKMIEAFGDDVLPSAVDNRGYTALMWFCERALGEAAVKMIERFGKDAKPEQAIVKESGEWVNRAHRRVWGSYSTCESALHLACLRGLEETVETLIDKFKHTFRPLIKHKYAGKTVFEMAFRGNRIIQVLNKAYGDLRFSFMSTSYSCLRPDVQ